MKKGFLLLLVLALHFIASSQTALEDSLKKELLNAVKPADKITWLRELGTYYITINTPLSDQYGIRMIEIADSSRQRDLMCRAYLGNAERYYNGAASQLNIIKGIEYSQKALDIARENNLSEYTAWAYTYLARGSRNNAESDKAINYNNLAVTIAADVDNDSLKVYVWNSLGNTYLARNEKLLAFRNYLQALNLAERTRNNNLIDECYKRMSAFYGTLENYEKAKDYEFKRCALEQEKGRYYDVMYTYSSIGHLYSADKQYDQAERYYNKAFALADSLKYNIYKITCYINIVNLYLNNQLYEKGLAYFNAHPEINFYLTKAGMNYLIDQAYGSMYMLTGQLDSAGHYFKKAAPYYETRATRFNKYFFYGQMALYHKKRNNYDSAINYWQKGKLLGEQLKSLDLQQIAAQNLDSLYQAKNDFKNAFTYNSLYHTFKDSIQKMSKEKDLMSLEIDNENRRKEREAKEQEELTRRRHYIQYMGITVAIAAIFILLVMAGAFRVSKTSIKILGFFAFIFLFEFIILLADNLIHDWTHGEPWKVLAIKIGLIAILLPLHHWLEEKVIHYLSTQELLHLRGKGFLGRWFRKKDANVPVSNPGNV
jgi:tetratricopeptide (TPR) repeat protein